MTAIRRGSYAILFLDPHVVRSVHRDGSYDSVLIRAVAGFMWALSTASGLMLHAVRTLVEMKTGIRL
jgi:hypothetical protein